MWSLQASRHSSDRGRASHNAALHTLRDIDSYKWLVAVNKEWHTKGRSQLQVKTNTDRIFKWLVKKFCVTTILKDCRILHLLLTAATRQSMTNTAALITVADIVGWGYFLSWTVSFFPQIYENWRRKCVVGFSFDMWAYFFLSYITYMIYNVTVYFDPKAIMSNLDQDNPVKLTDVVFSIVAFACTTTQGIQCLMYDRGSQEIHRSTIAICAGCLLALVVLTVLSLFGILGSWFVVLQYCGYVKFIVSFGTVSTNKLSTKNESIVFHLN